MADGSMFGALSDLLATFNHLIASSPMIGWAALLLPATAGLANYSAGGAVVGAALGALAGLIVGAHPVAALLIWIGAFIVAGMVGYVEQRRREADRRHRELVEAMRDRGRGADTP